MKENLVKTIVKKTPELPKISTTKQIFLSNEQTITAQQQI